MDIKEQLKQYKDVATFLDDDINAALIDNLLHCIENRLFYLPFIGQFSAGKSKLINRLIGKDVLPVKQIETTAFLTYISYADKESAVLEYQDGTIEHIEVEQIKTLDHQRTRDGKGISALRYSAPIELLKSGLVIVDTPGVNTLVTNHVKITENLLRNSQYIVYVMSSALTDTDKQMLLRIDSLGIDLLFARTHVDKIHNAEEDAMATIQSEIKAIESTLGKSINHYALCNDPDSSDFTRWQTQFENFKEFISDGIADGIDNTYATSARNRLLHMKEQFEKCLDERQRLMSNASEMTKAQIDEAIAELSKTKYSFNNRSEQRMAKYEALCKSSKSALASLLQTTKQKHQQNFDAKVEFQIKQDCNLEVMKEYFQTSLGEAVADLTRMASDSVEKHKANLLADVTDEIENVNIALKPLDIAIDTTFDEGSLEAFQRQLQDNLADVAEKYCQVKALSHMDEATLGEYNLQKDQIDELLKQYEDNIIGGNKELQEILSSYKPQYIAQGGQLGGVLKRVGSVADIAMLLIPAAGWSKAGTMLAKQAGTLAKSGSVLAKTGSVVLGELSQAAKLMAETDTMLDTAKLLKYATQGGPSPKSLLPVPKGSKTGIFDYLSCSYWFEKIGNMLDPVTYVEDQNVKAQYESIVRQKQEEINMQVRQKVSLIQKKRQITNQAELKRLEIEQREQLQEQQNEQLKREKEKLETDARRKWTSQTIAGAKKQFGERIAEFSTTLLSRAEDEIDTASNTIISSLLLRVNADIEKIETQMNEWKAKDAQNSSDIQRDTNRISELRNNLNSIND